jgi:hypothetical protein
MSTVTWPSNVEGHKMLARPMQASAKQHQGGNHGYNGG